MATSQLFVELRVKHELNVCTTMRIKKGLSKGVAKKKRKERIKGQKGEKHTHLAYRDKCEMQFSSYGIALISTVAPSGFFASPAHPSSH